MKKALAALLASFVGLFGYQIVDKAIEERVNNLEYQVSSQQEEIESLQGTGNHSLTTRRPLPIGYVSPEEFPDLTLSISAGDTQYYIGQTKFLFREYTNGAIKYISPDNSDSINESKVSAVNNKTTIVYNEEQAEIAPSKYELSSTDSNASTSATLSTEYYNDPSSIKASEDASKAMEELSKQVSSLLSTRYINDYFLFITEASRTIISKKDYHTKVYDEFYSTHNQVYKSEYNVRYLISGKTDKELSGREIIIYTQEGTALSTIIQNDGTFTINTEVYRTYLLEQFFSLRIKFVSNTSTSPSSTASNPGEVTLPTVTSSVVPSQNYSQSQTSPGESTLPSVTTSVIPSQNNTQSQTDFNDLISNFSKISDN